jgi:membrane protease YdiL (CAAX protease family)
VYAEAEAQRDGRLLDRRAGVLVAAAIGLGGVLQLISLALGHSTSIEPEALIRYDIVLTLGFYAVVAVLIVSQITPSVRLRWGDGPLLGRIAYGAAFGVGISLLLLGLVSAAAGHLQSDPRIVLLMSEGDPTHIIVTVLIGCVAAPLVEETLFRGLLLESLLPRGARLAVVVSAAAFAVWHFMPTSLVYYTALGAVLGGIYLKRGLVGSIAAHVGFNAVLTIAAISMVLGPSHVVRIGSLSLTAPRGWSVDTSGTAERAGVDGVLRGPDASELEVVARPAPAGFSAGNAAQRLQSGQLSLPGVSLDTAMVSEVTTPVGEVVEAPITVANRDGRVALFGADGQAYAVVFLDSGSAVADRGFNQIIASLRFG